MTKGDDMKTAAIAQLKSGLSEYISIVKAGEEVIVTERGKPVAKIVSIKRDDAGISAHLKSLEKKGLARIGCAISDDFLKASRHSDKGDLARRSLLDERQSSR